MIRGARVDGTVTQWSEYRPYKPGVDGSNPSSPIKGGKMILVIMYFLFHIFIIVFEDKIQNMNINRDFKILEKCRKQGWTEFGFKEPKYHEPWFWLLGE